MTVLLSGLRTAAALLFPVQSVTCTFSMVLKPFFQNLKMQNQGKMLLFVHQNVHEIETKIAHEVRWEVNWRCLRPAFALLRCAKTRELTCNHKSSVKIDASITSNLSAVGLTTRSLSDKGHQSPGNWTTNHKKGLTGIVDPRGHWVGGARVHLVYFLSLFLAPF